jgi:hypothetical protein
LVYKKEVKILKKTVTKGIDKGIEKRVVSGKARDCKIVDGKVSNVYDEVSKQYLPIKEFQKLYNEKGERLGIEDVKDPVLNVSQIKLISEEDVKGDIEEEDIDPYNWYLKKIYRK